MSFSSVIIIAGGKPVKSSISAFSGETYRLFLSFLSGAYASKNHYIAFFVSHGPFLKSSYDFVFISASVTG